MQSARGPLDSPLALSHPQGFGAKGLLMAQYAAHRLLQLIFVLIGVSMVVFVTMHLLPGDVAQMLLGDRATNAELARRMGQAKQQVERLFDLRRYSRFDQIEAAFAALGKQIAIEIRDAA